MQFTPDLLPADITGSAIFDQRDNEFEFRPGPIFTNLLLADEINRAPPKTQAALLEAMQERQVTDEGDDPELAPPFVVIATQNPIEYEGTYPLPEAQLDRFILRSRVGYPALEHERDALAADRAPARTRSRSRRSSTRDAGRDAALARARRTSGADRRLHRDAARRRATTRACQVGASPRGGSRCSALARERRCSRAATM